jgi:hypothetical protein
MTRIAIAALGLLLLGCFSRSPLGEPDASQGVEEAKRDIVARTPWIFHEGQPQMMEGIDAETGLPRNTSGCNVTPGILARNRAYNATILEALKEGRLAGLTMGHKRTSREALEARFLAEGGGELSAGSRPIPVPGGSHLLSLEMVGSSPPLTPMLFLVNTSGAEHLRVGIPGGSRVRVLFDHGGTTLLLRNDEGRFYRTFDLPRRLALENFEDSVDGRGR